MRWIVDAMNVVGSRPDGWWKNRRGALLDLVDQLERWALADGYQVTVVFERPMSPPVRSSVIEIAHAPAAAPNSADDEIVRLLRADEQPAEITVVTSDGALIERVRGAGASTFAAAKVSQPHRPETVTRSVRRSRHRPCRLWSREPAGCGGARGSNSSR